MKWEYKHMIPSLSSPYKDTLEDKNKSVWTLPVVETMGYVINTDSESSPVYGVCYFTHVAVRGVWISSSVSGSNNHCVIWQYVSVMRW